MGPRVLLLALRVDRAPFADPRLREALELSLDRGALARAVLPLLLEPQIVAVSRRLRWEPPFNLALRPETLFPADE